MRRDLNKALIIGNLGADPDVRVVANGSRFARFSVATNRTWTDQSGLEVEKTEWHRIFAWDKVAEIAARLLHKGDLVFIEGTIEHRSYMDRQGVAQEIAEIRAWNLVLLNGRGAARTHDPFGPEEPLADVPF